MADIPPPGDPVPMFGDPAAVIPDEWDQPGEPLEPPEPGPDDQPLDGEYPPEGPRVCERCGVRDAAPRRPGSRGRFPKLCAQCAGPSHRAGDDYNRPPGGGGQVRIDMRARPTRGAAKADRDKQLVEDKARQFAQFAAAILLMVGQEADAKDVTARAGGWAEATGGLAPFEPWLVKLCSGGEASGRALAWLGFAVATAGMSLPVLLRHELIPEGPLRQAITSTVRLAESVPS